MNLNSTEHQEEIPANPTPDSEQTLDPATRRWALGKFGFVAVAAVAKLLKDAQPASAELYSPGSVCDLRGEYYCDYEPAGKCYYTCPSSHPYKEWWYAPYGINMVGCGECTDSNDSNCFTGYWKCSQWWYQGSGMC